MIFINNSPWRKVCCLSFQ